MASSTYPLVADRAHEPISYPTSDGRPMGETDLHRDIMVAAIQSLQLYYAGQQVYVSGNILLHYQPGNRRRHVSPDVLVAKGLDPHPRDFYLLWEEGKPPDVVIEVTSKSTRDEDLEDKFEIYRDKVGVPEYFLFDPRSEYLDPPLQGYRLQHGQYVPIEAIGGRLPSLELGFYLEQHGGQLRLFDPATSCWLPTPEEAKEEALAERDQALAERDQAQAEREQAQAEREKARAEREKARAEAERAEAERKKAEAEGEKAEARSRQAETLRQEAEAEAERLRRELEVLRRRLTE